MGTSASYWVASHLTGLFAIKDTSEEILSRGSLGAGVCINRGVVTTITKESLSSREIYFNQVKTPSIEATVTKKALDLVFDGSPPTGIRIDHHFEIPVSAGFSASAAGALGTVFAADELFELGFSRLELFQIAHAAEVYSNTGLGDVIALYQGGSEIRIKQGAPGIGQTIAMTNKNSWKIATIHIGPLATPEILSNNHKRNVINLAGEKLVEELISDPDFGNFVKLASQFSKRVNLWSNHLAKLASSIPSGIIAAQIMLGNALFLFYKSGTSVDLLANLNSSFREETICHETVVKRENNAN